MFPDGLRAVNVGLAMFALTPPIIVLVLIVIAFLSTDWTLPADFNGVRVVDWTWANISAFLARL